MSEVQVRLRPITEADLPDYVRWLNDPEVTQFTAVESGNITLEGEREWLARIADPARPGRTWAIEADSRHIGNCALDPHGAPNQQAAGFGIAIGDKAAWGKGYGTAAVREALRIGFEEMNLHRIELSAFGPNARAVRCYEKCGFRHEGVKRQAFLKRGTWLDVVMMGILREDWDAQTRLADRARSESDGGQVVLRSYRRGDYDQVVALWRSVGFHLADQRGADSRAALDRAMVLNRAPFLVAESGGRVVGTAMGSWDGRRAHIHRVAVDSQYRRRGIGRRVMSEVEGGLAALGARRINLWTVKDNAATMAFYRSLGYDFLDYVAFMGRNVAEPEGESHGS